MNAIDDFFLFYRFEHPILRRHYQVMLSQDLFGDWVVTKAWGGINQASGRIIHLPCPSLDRAKKIVHQLVRIREKRGYLLAVEKGIHCG